MRDFIRLRLVLSPKMKKKVCYFEIVKYNIQIFKWFGVWELDDDNNGNNTFKYLYLIYGVFVFVSLITFIISQLLNIVFNFGNLEEMTGSMFTLLTFTINLFKFHILYSNCKQIKELISYLDNELFQPKNRQQFNIFLNTKTMYLRVYKICNFLGVITDVFWLIYPFFNNGERILPMNAWYPFEYLKTPFYEYTYIYQIVLSTFNTILCLNADTFAAGLLILLGIQFDCICNSLENLDEIYLQTKDKGRKRNMTEIVRHRDGNCEDFQVNMFRGFKDCFQQYAVVLSLSKRVEKFYQVGIFVQFLLGVFVLCSTFFQLSLVTAFSTNLVMLIAYISAILTEIFLYCWFGNEVIFKSGKVQKAIFNSPWTQCDLKMKKNFLIFMLLARNPVVVRVGGIIPMSVQVYMTILRSSYSYFTILSKYRA